MKFIPKLLLCAFIVFSVNTVHAERYKSVTELFADEIDINDQFNQSIILQRCAGLFGALAKYWPGDDQGQKENLFNNSMNLLVMATMTMAEKRGLSVDNESINNQVQKAFNIYVDIYYEDMERHQIATGSIMSEMVKSDLQICSRFSK